jgi:hypothetical protein
MPHRLRASVLLLLASCLIASARAPDDVAIEASQARRVLDGLGVPGELAALAREALRQVEADRGRVAVQDRNRLRGIVRDHFGSDRLLAVALEELSLRLEVGHARVAATWLEDHAGLLARSQDANAACLGQAPLAELNASLTPERSALLTDLALGIGAAGRDVRRATLVFTAMLVASNDFLPEDRRFTADELHLMIASQRSGHARSHALDVRLLHCAYRGVPTATLRDTTGFFATAAGHDMRVSVDAAIEQTLLRAAAATARDIAHAFGVAPPASPLRNARARGAPHGS